MGSYTILNCIKDGAIMKNEKNDLNNFYENICDENNRLSKQKVNSIEFLTTMKYLQKLCPKESKILDACAGCGVYSFPLAQLGYHVTAGDLVEFNVEQIRKKQEDNPIIDKIYVGSALDLSQFKDNSFDIVLCLGAFYHMKDKVDRDSVIKECLRVLRKDGIFFLAYLNKYSNFIKFNQQWNSNFNIFEEYIEKGYNEDDYLFYATTPEAVEIMMTDFGMKQLHNVATDGMKFAIKESVNSLSDEIFERYLKLHYQMCEVKCLLGYSEHALYIGQK